MVSGDVPSSTPPTAGPRATPTMKLRRGAPLQLRPTRANGQPAFGYYLRSQPRGMMVLTLSGSKIDEITFFADPALPGRFGLPEHI